MFSRFEEFGKAPRHAKWREVNLAVELPGWRRFPPAAEWLRKNEAVAAAPERANFERFVAEHGGDGLSEAEAEALFKRYLAWREAEDRS